MQPPNISLDPCHRDYLLLRMLCLLSENGHMHLNGASGCEADGLNEKIGPIPEWKVPESKGA